MAEAEVETRGTGEPSTSAISSKPAAEDLKPGCAERYNNKYGGEDVASGVSLQWPSLAVSPSPEPRQSMRMSAPKMAGDSPYLQMPGSFPNAGSYGSNNMGNSPGSNLTLAALAPVPQARAVPVVQPPYAFQYPRKRINNPADIDHLHQSEAGKTFLGFIVALSDSMKGKKLSDYCRESPMTLSICKVLEEMNSWIDDLPPKQQPARYGNPTFREWQSRLEEQGPGLMRRILPDSMKAAEGEIFPYFADSFGNATRIDYGTGHEANFAAWLLCLARLGLVNEDDYQAIVAHVFVKYLDLMRRLQTTYWLEPAGQSCLITALSVFSGYVCMARLLLRENLADMCEPGAVAITNSAP